MRKVISCLLVLIMVLSLCACDSATSSDNNQSRDTTGEVYTIHCNDGTVKKMTAKEILDMYNNDGRTYDALLKGASISGTGIVSSIGDIEAKNYTYPDKIPCAWGQDVRVENGKVVISTFFAPKDNYVKLYNGDKVTFQGILSVSWGVVYIGTHYQMAETYLRYAG